MTSPRRVVFMGSPDFAVPSLDALCTSGRFRPSLVVSQPDRPRGRGRDVSATPVRACALAHGIPTLTMDKPTYAAGVRTIAEHSPEFVVVVAFGMILKSDLLDLPPLGCVNVHASLLPRHRGMSPIQTAILAGDTHTGCTTMHIDQGVDTGDMLLRESISIEDSDTAGTLSEKLSRLGAGLLLRTLDGLAAGTLCGTPQDHALATPTRKIRKHDGAIDWTRDTLQVWRLVRAMTPWPTAYTFLGATRLIITQASVSSARVAGAPGTVLGLDPLTVACADGALEIHGLRPEGKRAMTPREFALGHALAVGDRLHAAPGA